MGIQKGNSRYGEGIKMKTICLVKRVCCYIVQSPFRDAKSSPWQKPEGNVVAIHYDNGQKFNIEELEERGFFKGDWGDWVRSKKDES